MPLQPEVLASRHLVLPQREECPSTAMGHGQNRETLIYKPHSSTQETTNHISHASSAAFQSECCEQFDGLCSLQGCCKTKPADSKIVMLCDLATFHAECDGRYAQAVHDAKERFHEHKIDMDGGHPLDDVRTACHRNNDDRI